ncbi:type IIL restriction-modification enzyme MmeI [Staphylococcus sp. GDY8P168P-1]|nr:type IIL restriction-modification enzyme MmeI [Staphylococcus sp. GDY8P168P-1]
MQKELVNRSYDFVKLHINDSDEKQQAQMWIRDFLEIFNVAKQKINIGFEWRVNIDGSQKYADHLLNGILLIEMKSKGIKLDKAKSQAYRYVMNLDKEDIPKYVILSNFDRIQLLDLITPQNSIDIRVKDIPKYVDNFNFLQSKVNEVHIPSNPVNEKAAKLMEKLHNSLLEMNYP